ncbi:hypothetical protein [Streptomyces kanasensis]|uniref:hypothetical protein n=1 Tax=Streptomyces kanasensis TaxID=936756 RepID=UPI0037027B94
MRRRHTAVLAAALALASACLLPTTAAATAGPGPLPPVLPAAESLVTEGVSVEGPLINNVTLPFGL